MESAKRIEFKDSSVREKFFNETRTKFNTWKELRDYFHVAKSSLEYYRNGKRTIPYSLFIKLLKLHQTNKNFYINHIRLKNEYWGKSKGGKSTYSKHKYIFEKGRRIALQKSQPKYEFKLNTPLNNDFCELLGAFIGDGFTNSYGKTYVVQFTGHAVLDRKYFINTLIPVIKKLCSNSNPILSSNNNTLRLTINSKEFHRMLTKRFGFPRGKKSHSVVIPLEIMESSNKSFVNRCIRGIFDTDGCVYFDKRNSYKKPYLKIDLHMKSKNLLWQIHEILNKEGIKVHVNDNVERLQINGFIECKKFTEIIGFSNSRHTSKIGNI